MSRGHRAESLPDTVLEKLAEAAHELWCIQMIEDGWRPGPVVDADLRTHDALIPFSKLDHDDRWTAIESVAALHLETHLDGAITYPRGEDRPLTTQEMAVGLRVESALEPERPGQAPARGRITEWGTNPKSQRLDWFRVRWDDGETGDYCPLEMEVRKVL